ncbi:MAG TPA: hypothetical protein VL485_15925 [Ktedonobacteraceae bacterium]|nr:hypothetical protein [Ktedonobacteraceae bacterium]
MPENSRDSAGSAGGETREQEVPSPQSPWSKKQAPELTFASLAVIVCIA